jgi:hypothetical protein
VSERSGRLSAQARADRIRAFREELAQLELEQGAVLTGEQRTRIAAHHDGLLADLAGRYDIDTTATQKQLALGLRIASFLGALAFCIAVVLFVERFWGGLTTGTQVALLILATLVPLVLTEVAARRERTLYFAALAALVAFTAFVTNLSLLGRSRTAHAAPSPSGAASPWPGVATTSACPRRALAPSGSGDARGPRRRYRTRSRCGPTLFPAPGRSVVDPPHTDIRDGLERGPVFTDPPVRQIIWYASVGEGACCRSPGSTSRRYTR